LNDGTPQPRMEPRVPMPEPAWRTDLELLRRGDHIAWMQVAETCFPSVFNPLLQHARRMNSKYRGALPDEEVRELARLLTSEAFRQAMARIAEYDPDRAELPTWMVWLGKAKANGILGPILRQAHARALEYDLDDDGNRGIQAMIDKAAMESSVTPEDAFLQSTERQRLVSRVTEVLQQMSPEHARALLAVWARRQDGAPYPVAGAAEAMGKSREAMDSLLRRAERQFRHLWLRAHSNGEHGP
jgi:hypothetical protein